MLTSFSNRIAGAQTRIYGASAADLNNDGYLDLTTVNEVSADVRVFLNRADGSGRISRCSRRRTSASRRAHVPGDFNNDGNLDLGVSATSSQSVGSCSAPATARSRRSPNSGRRRAARHQALDVDGDGDLDVVNANVGSGNLALMINNGAGVSARRPISMAASAASTAWRRRT
jgi:hypothetical protein